MRAMRAVIAVLLLAVSAVAHAAPGDAYMAWGRVLAKFVNERGEIDFRALASERSDLDAFLDHVARSSPRSAPDAYSGRQAALAYYINAYNALSMFNVIESGLPQRLTGLRKIWFFAVKRFPVGGEPISLYALENDVIRPLGDERVHFALNCMAVGCPRLPREPFSPEKLDRQLDDEARRFFSEARNLQVLPERRLLRVSSLLRFYTEDFLARNSTLIAYINRYAPSRIPEDYRIEFIDYDWTVNDQQRPRGSS